MQDRDPVRFPDCHFVHEGVRILAKAERRARSLRSGTTHDFTNLDPADIVEAAVEILLRKYRKELMPRSRLVALLCGIVKFVTFNYFRARILRAERRRDLEDLARTLHQCIREELKEPNDGTQ